MIRSIALFVVVLLNAFNLKAQTDWKKIYSDNGVSVYSRTETCKNKMGHTVETNFIKIENHSYISKTIEWDYEFIYNDLSSTKAGKENHKVVKIGSNETIEGDCSLDGRKDLKVEMFFKDIKLTKEITEVKIINVKVDSIKSGK